MQRYFSKEKKEKELLLSREDWFHISKVMRMKNHDKIEVVYQECVYLCEIFNVPDNHVFIKEKLENTNDTLKEITLILPLLKEQKFDYILQKATELGVSRIIPTIMERSIVKFDGEKEEKKIARWTKICKEASEQSMRVRIPIITEIKTWEYCEQLKGVKFVCSTREKQNNLKKFLNNHPKYDKLYIVVGPEGGLSEKEEKRLMNMGFEAVSLGDRIMRVETVPLFLLSVLNFQNME